MSEVEIIDVTAQVSYLPLDEALEYALAVIRECTHSVWAQFTISTYEVTVAEDSDILLLQKTVSTQAQWSSESRAVRIGPYPAQLTFDEAKAESYHLSRHKGCILVRAYQLDEPGWVERVNSAGESFSHWHGMVDDWYVKDPDAATIFVVSKANFVQCPCPEHQP